MKEYILYHGVAMLLAFLLDQIVGDIHGLPHPICAIGKWIQFIETHTRKWFPATKTGERTAGCILVLLVLLPSVCIPTVIVMLAYRVQVLAGIVAETILAAYMLAARSLTRESMRVEKKLTEEGLDAGRQAVAMIVGRDTDCLDESGVLRAAVESVAENTSDGVIAPLFYLLFGIPFVYFYKAVNTMDSMVGYHFGTYRYYGTCAAKLDDLCNLLPSRLSAGLLIVVTFICSLYDNRYDAGRAYRIFRRDRFHHSSPNSAQTESVVAGALGLRLGGDTMYHGQISHRQTLGDACREIEAADIRRANVLMQIGAWLMLVLELLLLALLYCKISGLLH